MSQMMTVFNARNNKFAKAEKIDADTYTLIFDDGTQKEVKEATFKKWYKEVNASDITNTPKSTPTKADTAETPAPTPEAAPEAPVAPTPVAPTPEADPAVDEEAKKAEAAAKKAKKDEEAAAKKAAAKAKKDEEAAAKKAEDVTKKAEAKLAKEAAAQAKAEAKKLADEAKEAKKLEQANKPTVNAKDRNKNFFVKFLEALNAKEEGFSKAGARDRNYMSFPAGASGFKYKFVYNEGKLNCSLYIFGPKIVTTALFNGLTVYKAEIEKSMSDITLDWNAPEELNTRRVITILEGSDDELIKNGVDTLISFRDVFNKYIDKITS